jgi:serine protease SohB
MHPNSTKDFVDQDFDLVHAGEMNYAQYVMENITFGRLLVEKISPELLIFFGQTLTILLALVAFVTLLAFLLTNLGIRPRNQAHLEAKSLNDEWIDRKRSLESLYVTKKEWKARLKEDRENEKRRVTEGVAKPRVWVIDFKGDIEASRTESLRNEITAILEVANRNKSADQSLDEVLVRLESPGGSVTGYGLAASQLMRLRKAGVPLTIAIDEIAASGGYMMAVVANRVIASPFAVLGSIGVVGQLPNFNRLLKKYEVDYLEVTAGEHKRPVSMLGPITDEGLKKFRTQIEEIHGLFREHVKSFRPQLDLQKTANGDIWYGLDALKLGLIDEVLTSDEWLDKARHVDNRDVFQLSWKPAKSWKARFEENVSQIAEKAIVRAIRSASWLGLHRSP